jgi:hypothetical protein
MRPPVGLETYSSRPRRSSFVEHTNPGPSSGPTTFFLRTEEDLEKSIVGTSEGDRDSIVGTRSSHDTLGTAIEKRPSSLLSNDDAKDSSSRTKQKVETSLLSEITIDKKEQERNKVNEHNPGREQASNESIERPQSSSPKYTRKLSHSTISQPITPIRFESPLPHSSVLSTPRSSSMKSFRLSDEESQLDDTTSQAVTSSEDEYEKGPEEVEGASDFLELVMPRIQMPRRRPFTSNGKALGRLKILIAGRAGKLLSR